MKTAISVDDQLLHEADEMARRMGLSRSRLFALALQDYLAQRRRQRTLEQLNLAYATEPGADEKRVASRMKSKFRSIVKDRW